jgi:pimeloyl-ACP methyl ester carboxylesterase
VLVHGLLANPIIMESLARWLKPQFHRVVNWGYSSLWSPIERHARKLAELLHQLDGECERIHLVTHSMGGIIARVALADFLPSRFGRLVMIAPPNRGSHIARRLAPYLGMICPPLLQLTDHNESFVCSLPPPAIDELGIIAAKTDFLVLEPSTRLGCERDYIVLPGLHSSLLWRQETARQVHHFLAHGRFLHEAREIACRPTAEYSI